MCLIITSCKTMFSSYNLRIKIKKQNKPSLQQKKCWLNSSHWHSTIVNASVKYMNNSGHHYDARWSASAGPAVETVSPAEANRSGLHDHLIMKFTMAQRSLGPLRHHTAADSLSGGLTYCETAGQGM